MPLREARAGSNYVEPPHLSLTSHTYGRLVEYIYTRITKQPLLKAALLLLHARPPGPTCPGRHPHCAILLLLIIYMQVSTAVVVIVLDLSNPAGVLPSALHWLSAVRAKLAATYGLFERRGLAQLPQQLRARQRTKVLGQQHPDAQLVECTGGLWLGGGRWATEGWVLLQVSQFLSMWQESTGCRFVLGHTNNSCTLLLCTTAQQPLVLCNMQPML